VVDLGQARADQQQAAGAADSAALAAAMVLRDDETAVEEAAEAARTYVEANFSVPADSPAWSTCTDPSALATDAAAATGSCVSVDVEARRVRVTVPGRQVPSVFAGVLGVSPPAVSSTATAAWGGSGTPAVPCVLCDEEPVRLVR
jgi:uncharacterized membrane protein